MTKPDGRGDCFIVAATLVTGRRPSGHEFIDNCGPEWTLVHAVVLGSDGTAIAGLYHWHAWAEVTVQLPFVVPDTDQVQTRPFTWAVDKSNGQDVVLPAAYYRQRGEPIHLFEYSRNEAASLLDATGNFGPWVDDYGSMCDV